MAWRFVKQPNGMLARFSDVVEDFTHYNMTPEEAIELCVEELNMGKVTAREKVQAGIDDIEPWSTNKHGDGLSRWRDAIESLGLNHSKKVVTERVKELTAPV